MTVDELLDAYERGDIDRRSVVLDLGEASRADVDDSTFVVAGLNHVAVCVSDVAFNPDFLMAPLRNINDDEVYLDLIDEMSPGVIKNNSSFLYVLMPMRVSQ